MNFFNFVKPDMALRVFFGRFVLPTSEETRLESSNQEASPSTVKNTRVVLEAYRT